MANEYYPTSNAPIVKTGKGIISEECFRAALHLRLRTLEGKPGCVTGPGRSGAIASAYASHALRIPWLPFGSAIPEHLAPVLVIDTATKTGRTLRKACRSVGVQSIPLAVFNEPPRLRFWYEDRAQLPTYATVEYRVWSRMKDRCKPNAQSAERYFHRGIGVCQEWMDDFDAFLQDVGPRPSPNYWLERIDNDKGYQPGNVRWATTIEQATNRSSTRYVEFNGQRKSISGWARTLGIHHNTLLRRLNSGWSVEDALSRHSNARRENLRNDLTGRQFGSWSVIARDGDSYPIRYVCRCECGTERSVVMGNLTSGHSRGCGCAPRVRRIRPICEVI